MQSAEKLGPPSPPSSSSSDRKGGLGIRKHGLDVVHAEYRRESFHCEHALQSLMEIEGENTPGALPSPPDQTPTHMPVQHTLSPARQLGRQDSIMDREFEGKSKQADSSEAVLKTASKTEPVAIIVDLKSTLLGETTQKDKVASKFESSQVSVASMGKDVAKDVGKIESSSTLVTGPKIPVRTPIVQSSGVQELKPHSLRTESPKGLDYGKDIGKTPVKEKTQLTKTPEASKSGKGALNVVGTGSGSIGTPKISEAVPSQSNRIQERAQTPSGSTRAPQEERCRLEAVEDSPASPSPTARSPCTSKSRAISPGDRSSFVTQLTSVAKTVLGPMKLGSQDGGKAKDSSKTNEDKRAATLGKSEASSGGRRGLTGTWPGPGSSSKPEKASKSSSKHS